MGKPLISDAALRGMYEAMQRIRAAKRQVGDHTRAERSALQAEPEALLVALLSELRRRDTLLTEGPRSILQTALSAYFPIGNAPAVHTCNGTVEECAAMAVGMALRTAGKLSGKNVQPGSGDQPPRPVVIALLSQLSAWKGTLTLIQEHDLPVLLIAGGEAESRADAQRRLQSTRVPIMPVDRCDAVAICRVMQECLLRARNGWGGAVIHAAPMPGSSDPLLLLRQHMDKRGLLTEVLPPA